MKNSSIPISINTQFYDQRVLFDLIRCYHPGADGNKGIHRIPQCSSITGASASTSLVSYPTHRVLVPCRDAFGVFYSFCQLGD